ncbi:MAG: DUF1828 domain-containing protein [Phycisphaerales bacterium]|nr:DUF1828 domain-containing protein [Phycisphaerales bacterium]
MATPCERIEAGLGELFVCSSHGDFVRLRTPFLYPDGDVIDLFWRDDGDTATLTDLGETLRWLRMQTVARRRTTKQNQLVADVCLNHGVELYQGRLQVRVNPGASPAEEVLRLAQASMRVADLWFTFRTRAVESVTDEVADFLTEKDIGFDRGERLPGRSGRVWMPDFHTRTARRSNLVFVLTTGSRSAARRITEHVHTAWYDLSHLKLGPEPRGFVSLFDDTMDVWADEDFRLLEDLSTVARWSSPDEFVRCLDEAA